MKLRNGSEAKGLCYPVTGLATSVLRRGLPILNPCVSLRPASTAHVQCCRRVPRCRIQAPSYSSSIVCVYHESINIYVVMYNSISEAFDLRPINIGIYLLKFIAYLPDIPVSYTHLRAHETRHDLVCR